MTHARGRLAPLLLSLVFAAGCGDVKTDNPPDGSDAPADTPVDTTVDATPDGTPDAAPDAPPDVAPDGEPDVEPDPEPDAEEDVPVDTGADLPDGWPTGNPTEWPYPTAGQCDGAGGFCSGGSELLCPWGFEPDDRRPHGRCADGGWCCVVAPYSECTDSSEANCFVGTTCTDVDTCLGDPTTAYTCETDRVCCIDTCG
ncbi:MAG: hypothetical protein JRG91_14205 [Deltaproteobacteria bacterium]|nr:hypothetical protein [Deltaproteobacteria bacterium]